jgi:transcriptional regulator with XRE-family HTH domain
MYAHRWKPTATRARQTGGMAVKRPATRQTLAENLAALMAQAGWNQVELSKRSGVSQRQISNILRQETGCSIEHADALARAFGLQGWHLIMPTLRRDLSGGALEKLIDRYAAASAEGRAAIDRIAELESRYSKNNH